MVKEFKKRKFYRLPIKYPIRSKYICSLETKLYCGVKKLAKSKVWCSRAINVLTNPINFTSMP